MLQSGSVQVQPACCYLVMGMSVIAVPGACEVWVPLDHGVPRGTDGQLNLLCFE